MLSLSELLKIPYVDSGLKYAVSPNGERIIFSWNKNGAWELWEYKNQTLDVLQLDVQGATFSPRFSADGSLLAFALDFDGSESYAIVLHNLKNNALINLTPNSGYAHQPNFDFSPDGSQLAILSNESGNFSLYLLSIQSGEKKALLDLQRPIWDVVWSPNGKFIVVEVEWQASDRALFVVEVESGQAHPLVDRGKIVNAQHPLWTEDSTSLIFSGENGEWFDLGLFNVETRETTWLNQSVGDDTQPTLSRDGKIVGWIHSSGARTTFQFKESGGEIREVKIGAGVHAQPQIVGDEVFILYEDVNRPCDLWKIELENGEATQITKSLGADLHFPQPEEIWYGGMDETPVPALLYRGDGNFGLLDIHGGPNWHLQFSWNPILSWATLRGWTILAPNYRGSTGYGKRWQNASRYDMGGADNDDCAAGAQYLLDNGLAKKVAVSGRSHGGYLTMMCLTRYPHLFVGGAAVVPFLNWFKSHEESRDDLRHWNIENMGDPETHFALWRERSPYFFLDRVAAPVQMICGENDPRCPPSDAIDARDRLIELGKEVELWIYKNEGHTFYDMKNVLDSESKRVAFLEKISAR